uniref:Uncharacterized protein n=1 Tax=Arundo donax TaxID=35708 RepID=A0A0A8Z8S1_ARUDO
MCKILSCTASLSGHMETVIKFRVSLEKIKPQILLSHTSLGSLGA